MSSVFLSSTFSIRLTRSFDMPAYKDTKRGTWYVKISKRDPVTNQRIQTLKRGFQTKREALLWEAEQTVDKTKHTAVTFREMDEKLIAFKNPKKETTKAQERSRVNKYIPFADVQMSKIKKTDLMEWFTDLSQLDIAVSTKNYLIGVVKAVFKFGHDFYGLPNEAAFLKKYKRLIKPEAFNTWTPEEFNKFIKAVDAYHYKNIFTVMFWTGCRRGEALALRSEDYKDGTLHIYHQLKYEKDGFMPLKTDSSERTIKVIEPVKALLDDIPAELDGNEYLFGYMHPLPITNLQRAFTRGITKSNVKPIRLHDLRHSFATNAIAQGANIVALSKYLGHSTIQQTLQTYVHALEKTDDELLNLMNNLAKS